MGVATRCGLFACNGHYRTCQHCMEKYLVCFAGKAQVEGAQDAEVFRIFLEDVLSDDFLRGLDL
jgi:hypothetical protein